MREIADGVAADDPSALVLVAGDLNDGPDSPALAPLLGDGAYVDPLPSGAWTWATAGRRARLDYLLVPRAALPALLGAQVDLGTDAAGASDHRSVVADLLL